MTSDTNRKATLCGFMAIGLWAVLALLTTGTGSVPAFQLSALTFAVASIIGVLVILCTGSGFGVLNQSPKAWAIGLYGLFGYHALYFAALKLAPPAEAGLIAYLWPLLIVLMTALLPGEKLAIRHVIAAMVGFCGVLVLGLGKGGIGFDAANWSGYLAALGCAFIWSSYSVLSRTQAKVPTEAVTGFCLATAVLSGLCHMLFETTVWPQGAVQWLAIIGLGLGPVGAAFFLWDYGVKHGNIRLLGTASYAAPVLSTILLVIAGYATAHWTLGLACLLIVGAAVIARDR
ncbi:MAG: aromatic amino acid exporter YddG [Beijerinckiaceae bacterium]